MAFEQDELIAKAKLEGEAAAQEALTSRYKNEIETLKQINESLKTDDTLDDRCYKYLDQVMELKEKM